ncbi:hypothetical protein MM236_19170 [Belliella sp. DSM 107340]|uniref:Phage tail tube protein n=1 Tax=Belliella calami TaxID=2923436 RepID=A0ABS9UUM6_9BACT|nr:hypothetical protein [Belliella calami]MCH7400125.1 hypothetical protein [Belliella calami]
MGKVRYGAKRIELGVFDPETGATSAYFEMPVYRDTFTMTEPEPAVTEHFQQGKINPRVRRVTPASIEISFQLMDTDADSLAAALGGTVTTVDGVKKWNAPKNRGEKLKALRITVEDDSVIEVPAFSHYVRPNFEITEANINLLDVSGVVLDSGLDEVPDFTWSDPEPDPEP